VVIGHGLTGRFASISSRMQNSPATGNVHAKTDTMSNISTLAGYVTSADGEPMALVVMVNNFEGTGAQARTAIDAIATRVATFSRDQPSTSCCAR
jgi:D-alanyl-D-alanine carboxypeptidase/D-alanyl-D-alanine-endopeptidase (penicillin-binding protein 4)